MDDSPAAALATVRTLLALGFDEGRAHAAVEAIGDKSDVQLAISWLLDHGEEDRGGAVAFRQCSHLNALPAQSRLAPTEELAFGRPCSECDSTKENWICLFCGRPYCSRYVAKHSLEHWQETRRNLCNGHHLMISEGDLSVWCHECEAYIENADVQPYVERLRAVKFGEGSGTPSSSAGSSSSSALGQPDQTAAIEEVSMMKRGKHKASAGLPSIPEDSTQPSRGEHPNIQACSRSKSTPPSPLQSTLPSASDVSYDVNCLLRKWEQTMSLIDGQSEDVPTSATHCQEKAGISTVTSPADEDIYSTPQSTPTPIPIRDLEVKGQGELAQRIFKSTEGTLSLLVCDHGKVVDEFVFTQRSVVEQTRPLFEWINNAIIDLKYHLPPHALPPHARAAVEAQASVLADCLALRCVPFTIRLKDPTRRSFVDLSKPRVIGALTPDERPGCVEPPERHPRAPADGLAEIAHGLQHARNVVVMLGAGASVSAGIPDFRSPGTGLYSQLQEYNLPFPEAIFDLHFFMSNPAPFYKLARALWPGQHAPTPVHHFVRMLANRGLLRRCYTQNIDSLEVAAGVPAEKVVAAHGNFDGAHSWIELSPGRVERGVSVPVEQLKRAIFDGNDALEQLNLKYGGLVKPDITFFAEPLPSRFSDLVPDDFECCDLLIVIGTSLQVMPFASLVDFPDSKVPRLLINREPVGPFASGMHGGNGPSRARYYFLGGECDAGVFALARHAGMEAELLALVEEFASAAGADAETLT